MQCRLGGRSIVGRPLCFDILRSVRGAAMYHCRQGMIQEPRVRITLSRPLRGHQRGVETKSGRGCRAGSILLETGESQQLQPMGMAVRAKKRMTLISRSLIVPCEDGDAWGRYRSPWRYDSLSSGCHRVNSPLRADHSSRRGERTGPAGRGSRFDAVPRAAAGSAKPRGRAGGRRRWGRRYGRERR